MELKDISIYWLIDKLITKKHTDSELNDIFNKVKAMHKEEIEEAYMDGTAQFANDARIDYPKSAEQYYNETFGG